MVKKKTTKTRKGVVKRKTTKVKTKKESKDTKQDKELKALKRELNKLARQVLDNAKMRLPRDKFRKLRSSVLEKIPLANTKRKVDKLTDNLLRTPYMNIPSQLARDAKASLDTAKQEIRKTVEKELKSELDEPIKQYNQMKKDLNDVIEKYNNGELSVVEVAVAYKSAKKFANTVGDYLPSVSELNSTYRSVKNKLNYLRSWVSSRLRSGDTITELQALPPPTSFPTQPPEVPEDSPPPAPSPDPPPAPPAPSPSPSPAPTPPPTFSRMYDSAKQTIENNNPFILRTGQALVGLGMLEGGTRLFNRLYRTGRNRDIVRERMEDAGATMTGRLAQQASQAVLDQLNRETNDIQGILNEAEGILQEGNDYLERTTNRPPLRKSDLEKRERQQMGNNLKEEGILRRSASQSTTSSIDSVMTLVNQDLAKGEITKEEADEIKRQMKEDRQELKRAQSAPSQTEARLGGMSTEEFMALPQRERSIRMGLVENPFFGIRPRAREFVEPQTARRNQRELDRLTEAQQSGVVEGEIQEMDRQRLRTIGQPVSVEERMERLQQEPDTEDLLEGLDELEEARAMDIPELED